VSRRLALLIATHEHDDPTLRRLTSPSADVESLAAVLRDPQIAGFEVSVLVNEPHYRVGEAAVVRTIATGAFTLDVALSPTRPTGYVAQESAVGVFATDTNAFTTIPLPGEGVLEAVAVTPDGGRVFAVTRNGGRVIEIDAVTRAVTRITTLDPGAVAGDIAVTDDRAYVSVRSGDSLVVLDISGR
jgi:DNA-binding beta-propeller fold protein YncE